MHPPIFMEISQNEANVGSRRSQILTPALGRGPPHGPGRHGSNISRDQEKKCVMGMSWCCHGLEVRNRLRIDSYDDLLLPRHRLLTQLPVFASGEHFKNKIFVTRQKVRYLT